MCDINIELPSPELSKRLAGDEVLLVFYHFKIGQLPLSVDVNLRNGAYKILSRNVTGFGSVFREI